MEVSTSRPTQADQATKLKQPNTTPKTESYYILYGDTRQKDSVNDPTILRQGIVYDSTMIEYQPITPFDFII
jgi:hypothetical protein